MNMITPEKDLLKGSEMTANPALKKLMAAWESKQAKNARKAGGLGLVAVSLAACGSSSSSDPDPVDPVDPVPVGQTFTLTTGTDIFTGGEGDDVFNAPLAAASGSLQGLLGIQTLDGQDVLEGGEGRDTLNAELNATGTTMNPTITGIEVLNFTVMPLPALGAIVPSFGAIDLHRSEGYEEIWNVGSRYDLAVLNVRTNDDGDAPAIGLDGVRGGTTFFVEYDADEVVTVQNVIANNVGSAGTGSVTLDIWSGDVEFIETLNLTVSNGVRLILVEDAANIDNLNISGSGLLVLEGEDAFEYLVSLDSTGYTGDLDLDVSGSDVLESVLTGAGDDVVTVDGIVINGDFVADMGAGDNTLRIIGVSEPDDFSDLDFTGGVDNVQTISFVEGFTWGGFNNETPVLDLDGLGDLETIVFEGFIDLYHDNGNVLQIDTAPTDLELIFEDGASFFGLDVNGTENLSIGGTNVGFFGATDSALQGADLVTITADVSGDFYADMSENLDNLAMLSVTAGEDAAVALLNLDGDELSSLESVSLVAGEDADLTMTGRAPTAQVQTFTIAPGTASTWNFVVPGVGPVSVGTGLSVTGATAATNLAAAMNADPAFDDYTITSSGNTVSIVNNVAGSADPIEFTGVTGGGQGLAGPSTITLGEDGTGYEALEDIVVDAGEDATVTLTDVYGSFTVEVTAVEDADVTLTNTSAESVSVTAGMNVEYDIDAVTDEIIGFVEIDTATVTLDGNPNLVSLEVSGALADVTLTGDLSSLVTIDLTGVSEHFVVDATGAEFGWDLGESGFVTYLIGGTSSEWDLGYSTIASSAGDRETFRFTEDDFGTIVISDFNVGAGGDRIDLADLGFTNEGQLVIETGTFDVLTGEFTVDGAGLDTRIVDDAGGPDFSGTIILQGVDADDLTSNNITF